MHACISRGCLFSANTSFRVPNSRSFRPQASSKHILHACPSCLSPEELTEPMKVIVQRRMKWNIRDQALLRRCYRVLKNFVMDGGAFLEKV